jgi:hypothetical protein
MSKILMLSVIFCSFLVIGCPKTKAITRQPDFDLTKLSEKGQTAYKHLLNATVFHEGRIGYAGSLSPYITSFNVILKEKSADEAFKSLVENAKMAGKLYGLSGLYFTDYESFKKQVEQFKKNDETVQTMSGCIVFSEKISKIVELNKPDVAIIKKSETIEEFWKNNRGGSYELDIAHGGYPATFKSFANQEK